jgi:hypothetical protein
MIPLSKRGDHPMGNAFSGVLYSFGTTLNHLELSCETDEE